MKTLLSSIFYFLDIRNYFPKISTKYFMKMAKKLAETCI